jgi:hypothetical protein
MARRTRRFAFGLTVRECAGERAVLPGRVSFFSSRSRVVAIAAAGVAVALSSPARADVSSWLFTGGGGSLIARQGADRAVAPSFQLDTGLGLPATYPISVGGVARWQIRFGEGTELAEFVRTSTRGYNQGEWGAAIDLGVYERFFYDRKPGFAGTLSVGGPYGVTLNLDGADSTRNLTSFAVVLGIDLARFTVYRHSGLNWLTNPYPTPPIEARASN